MRAIVTVRFKEGVLDPEAVAIARALKGLGFEEVRAVRREKRLELDLDAAEPDRARERVRAMCEELLANPVIETYTIALENDR
ncbi:MAG: phosphoribosylformylglycinamidine synthase subunit PurS [Geminicoccaceae bacterium]|nr:phosphoribosylformylglycinamidine synthase subunit PurS [Geminicoccaceae bacterium]MCS7267261.1 phosphoribosylformylglycinamidine synthase subunit PurS [Geminicoccaceae bacterium]MCX7629830.1 phosphoribosylformylglycinamidine synthase subunit PurS [Geminicoccaceae bacterium]MDW8340748.1 phosphoribosylformylglycinamidine synthase subunit PurS [Geminicoccaceae bacterium]